MIGKIAKKGRGFRGLAAYLLRGGRGVVVAGPMAGRNARELAREFGVLRQLNPRLTKAVGHMMLSLAGGEALTDEQWSDVARFYVEGMGFANAPWLGVLHRDTDHEHLHIMASRVDFDGKTVSDANDFRRSEQLVRAIEKKYGLRVPPVCDEKGAGIRTKREKKMTSDETNDLHEPVVPDIQGRGAELGDEKTPPPVRREMRRAIQERSYEERMTLLFGDDFLRAFRHPRGAVLYFKQSGQIRDDGDKLSVVGPMEETLAAHRVVALAIDRQWPSISFTGSGSFVEKAMREALKNGMRVVAKDDRQQRILARILAERQGGAASSAGPKPMPAGATSADHGLDLDFVQIMHEIEDLPEVLPIIRIKNKLRDAQPQESKPAVVGKAPEFLNVRERLQAKRKREAARDKTAPQTKTTRSGPSTP